MTGNAFDQHSRKKAYGLENSDLADRGPVRCVRKPRKTALFSPNAQQLLWDRGMPGSFAETTECLAASLRPQNAWQLR